jgi:hypothetical protein
MDLDRILKSMTNVTPDQDKIKRIEEITELYKNTATILNKNCKDSRELRIAITNLENSLMWAVKSIILEY